jgi:rSAM/selenodomain-associated transferase 1
MPTDTVFVFTRAPRLGQVKRRLARGIGERAALHFHVATLHRLARDLARERRFRTVLAVTGGFLPGLRGVARVGQGRGDLGARMQRVLGQARRAVIVGSDIPQAGVADVRAAFRALGRADAVFGPSEDGGYWLVGFGPRRVARPFAGVRWSTEHALADTLANFGGRRVALLRRLSDVDTVDEYKKECSFLKKRTKKLSFV